MASSDIRRFYFYQKYLWAPTDFRDFQTWLLAELEGLSEGAFGAAVLSGLRALPGSGLNVALSAGIASTASGRIAVLAADVNALLTAPIGNPSRNLVVLRPSLTDMTFIPEPENIVNLVPLYSKLGVDVVVIPGTPAAVPAYPSIQAGDIIVAGVKLIPGQTTLSRSDFDLGIVDRPRKRTARISVKTATFAATGTDEIFEVDCSASAITAQLPPAGNVEGQTLKFVKIDSGANSCNVSGNLAELLSGQNAIELDTQWQTLSVYSNGTAWRVL